jgi:hypothetical protein
LYVGGVSGYNDSASVARSTNAQNSLVNPSFATASAYLGGGLASGGPNPDGILGQLWVAVDRSVGPRAGWVYMLATVLDFTNLDVHFVRSTDGGQTWSEPVHVNDDPAEGHARHWFGTMSVSPNGRIDAVWNDTRGSADANVSALYYSFSTDGGTTWSANEQASPTWNSTLGWPNQNKIGDYYHMISRDDGADLAWAATFNGEQDVYYMNIRYPFPAAVGDEARPFRLHPNQPNPFMSATTIRFDMPAEGGRAKLEVFDSGGRRVATLLDGVVGGGSQSARWIATDASGRALKTGVYLCRLEVAGMAEMRKLMVIR